MGWHRVVIAAGVMLTSLAATASELSLTEAIAIAREHNRQQLDRLDDVTLAELDYDAARAAFKTQYRASGNSNAVNGAELGSFYGLGMYRENLSGSRYAAGVYNSSFGDSSLSELRFSYTLPFFNQGKEQGNQLKLDRAETKLARRQRVARIALEELDASVTESYYRLILAGERKRMLAEQRDLTQRSIEQADIRLAAGELSQVDYDRAELRRQRTENAFLKADFQEQMAMDNLAMLLALDPGAEIAPTSAIETSDPLLLLDSPVDSLVVQALNTRQELVGQREELSLVRRRLDTLRDRVIPDLDVDINYSLFGEGNRFDDSLEFDDQRWGISVRMDTDFGAAERNSRRSKAFLHYKSLQRELDASEHRIRTEVRSRFFEVQQAHRELEIVDASHQLAKTTAEQVVMLADRGEVSDLERLESELALAESGYDVKAANMVLAIAMKRLSLALGGVQ